eukprot:8762795-Lingulodinium_polyedra.AAC.1
MPVGLASAGRPSPTPAHTFNESSAPSTMGGTKPPHGQAAAPWSRPRESGDIASVASSSSAGHASNNVQCTWLC